MLNQNNETYLYVHIPFCRSKCSYCSFYSVVSENLKETFTRHLIEEVKLLSQKYSDAKLRSIYFGGGTPSSLGTEFLSDILDAIREQFTLLDPEITIEVNPEDVDDDFSSEIKAIGFNRVSMGVQSTDVNTLKLLNRHADFEVVQFAFHSLRQAGFDNISLDIMYGLPHTSLSVLQKSVEDILSLQPEHLSIYCLTIDNKTVLKYRVDKGEINPKSDELVDEEYTYLLQILRDSAYERYEISNFSKSAKKSIHNSSYWAYMDTLGLGPSACYKVDDTRYENTSSLQGYFDMISNNSLPVSNTICLSDEELFVESLFMGLRQVKGVDYSVLKSQYKIVDDEVYLNWIEKYVKLKLMSFEGGRLQFINRGLDISNSILCEII